jgi:hypothetical protein
MKYLWIGLLILFPSVAGATSPEQSYLAARDAQIRKAAAAEKKLGVSSDRFSKFHESALADLEGQLKQLIRLSALTIPGVVKAPKINNEALLRNDLGFGMLDGLVYSSEDYKTRAVVTTEGLLKTWLRDHRKWWKDKELPDDPAKAVTYPVFYTQAVNSDATMSKYADLPITKPATATVAVAMLVGWAQDTGPWEPDELAVSVMQGGKLYVVRVPAGTKIGPFPACNALWDEAAEKRDKTAEAQRANPKAPDRMMQIENEGEAAYQHCFAERAPKEKGFAELVRQAQTIVDALPTQ